MSNPEVGIRLRFLNWQIAAHPVEIQTAELARRYDRLASRWQGIIQRMGFQRAYENLFARLHFQNKLHVRAVGSHHHPQEWFYSLAADQMGPQLPQPPPSAAVVQ